MAASWAWAWRRCGAAPSWSPSPARSGGRRGGGSGRGRARGRGRGGVVAGGRRQTAGMGGDRRLFAVGVAAPGWLDLARGRIVRYGLLPGFCDVPLVDHLRPHFDCPIYMEENIRALTLAELLRGNGRGHR